MATYMELCEASKKALILELAAAARSRQVGCAMLLEVSHSEERCPLADSSSAKAQDGVSLEEKHSRLVTESLRQRLDVEAFEQAIAEAAGSLDLEQAALTTAEADNTRLCSLLVSCSTEAERWRPESAVAWLERLQVLVGSVELVTSSQRLPARTPVSHTAMQRQKLTECATKLRVENDQLQQRWQQAKRAAA